MRNRYKDALQTYNRHILELCGANPYLFYVCAYELSARYKKGHRVLEIGCGEGHSAEHLLKRTDFSLDLLDVSAEMLASCKKRLRAFGQRTAYIHADALRYLSNAPSYDVIFSAWTVHNFPQQERRQLLGAIFSNLNAGGTFMLMDKVYPPGNRRTLLQTQNARYRYLPEVARRAVVAHEKKDATDRYRIDEKPFVSTLKRIGFRNIRIHDRVEREVVLTAEK